MEMDHTDTGWCVADLWFVTPSDSIPVRANVADLSDPISGVVWWMMGPNSHKTARQPD
jgi:hypothetical protein